MNAIYVFSFVACALDVMYKKPLIKIYKVLSKSFIVLALKFRSMIHFEFVLVYGVG